MAPLIGGLGLQGQFCLAGPPLAAPSLVAMPSTALPYTAHVYDRNWNFLATLGQADVSTKSGLLDHPGLQLDVNSGYQTITLSLSTTAQFGHAYGEGAYGTFVYGGLSVGQIIALTEQDVVGGQPDGRIVFAGTIETVLDTISSSQTAHQITAMPFVSQLGDAGFSKVYNSLTDVADIIRDAIGGTDEGGSVVGLVVTNGGVGYTSAPTISLTGGGGQNASATATLVAGVVVSIVVSGVGQGYTSPPDVVISGGGGSGATATAVVSLDISQPLPNVSCNWVSVPQQTGVMVTGNFNNTTVLDVVNQCRQMLGENWLWFVDEIGTFWMQPKGSQVDQNGHGYAVTDVQVTSRSITKDITQLRNQIQIIGGVLAFSGTPSEYTYNGASQATYGVRRWDPPLIYPGITDPAILKLIGDGLGAMFDRVLITITLALPNYPYRILPGQSGGALMSYFEPGLYALSESESGSGSFSGPWVVQEVKVDGAQQIVTIGTLPYVAQNDYTWEISRIAQRLGLAGLVN